MNLSKVFNRLSTELEKQVATAITELMDENNIKVFQVGKNSNNWRMCFYPDEVIYQIKQTDHLIWIIKTESDRIFELFDHAMVPLPDLLSILEELERHIEKAKRKKK